MAEPACPAGPERHPGSGGLPLAERAAVILAGGSARRLGGIDKPALVIDGLTLLDVAVQACHSCAHVVAVGPRRPTRSLVAWTRECPPGGGPLAALGAGMALIPEHVTTVTVLAADMPRISADAVERLHRAQRHDQADAAVLTDRQGRRQHLATVFAREPLVSALRGLGDLAGRPFHHLLAGMSVTTRSDDEATQDVDEPADLALLTQKPHEGTAATMDTFIAELCERLGVPIDDVDVNAILDLAKDVAHGVERPAAPVGTFIAGYAAAVKGGGTDAVDEVIARTAEFAGDWADTHGTPSPDEAPTLPPSGAGEDAPAGRSA